MAHAVSSCHVLFVTICHYSLTRASEHDSFLGAIAQRVYCCVTRVTVKVSSQWLSLAVSRGQVEGDPREPINGRSCFPKIDRSFLSTLYNQQLQPGSQL
ncbi:Protein of unknown function [Gryllus bimaculatus]|nr:Protein of unknown function [Gryllus bimaculatus]